MVPAFFPFFLLTLNLSKKVIKYFTYPTDDMDEDETPLNMNMLNYSETPPYGHLGNTVTSLGHFFLAAWQKPP